MEDQHTNEPSAENCAIDALLRETVAAIKPLEPGLAVAIDCIRDAFTHGFWGNDELDMIADTIRSHWFDMAVKANKDQLALEPTDDQDPFRDDDAAVSERLIA